MTTLRRRVPHWILVAAFGVVAAGANLLLGLGAAVGQKAFLLSLLVGLLPAMLIAFGALVEAHRQFLAWIALSVTFLGIGWFGQRLPVPGGTNIFLTDVLALLAIGAWLASRLSGTPRPTPAQLSPAFRWPLLLVAITVMSGVVIGHERYGASLIAQPFRIVLYASIALALIDTDRRTAWRAITWIFSVGAVIQALWAVYFLGTGTSQTDQVALSTGGVRVLALGSSIYLTGSVICALLNLEMERRPSRQFLHAVIAALALFGIVVAFGRTTYAAVALIVPVLLITRRYMRRTLLVLLPLFAPIVVLIALLLPMAAPSLLPTLENRLGGTSENDLNVVWRERARAAALEGVNQEWLTGVGFGRVTHFRLRDQVVEIHGDPHNSYVLLLAGGGVLALASFLLLAVTYVVDALRRLRGADAVGQALVIWSLGTWMGFMINAYAGPVLSEPIMMMTIWILIALPSLVPRTPAAAPGDAPAFADSGAHTRNALERA